MSGTIELVSGAARATIALRGAQCRSWSVEGLDLLWPGDAAVWDSVAPVLFPVVGWSRDRQVRIAGRTYPMDVHGFAAQCDFVIEEQRRDEVRLVLRASEATRVSYPFDFAFAVTYALGETELAVAMEIVNGSDAPMPYACGFHPGFRWPFDSASRDGHAIEFERDEIPHTPVIAPGGLFSDAMRPVSLHGNRLDLDEQTFAHEALCFLNARSRTASLVSPTGARIEVEAQSFAHFALWSRPAAPFVCIECWTGHGDPVDFDGELAQRPSMIVLEPGQRRAHRAVLRFRG